MGGSTTGSLLFGFLAGSALTAAAAYVMVASDLERLEKDKKRLEAQLHGGGSNNNDSTRQIKQRGGLLLPSASSRGAASSSASAIAATGEQVGFLTDIMAQLWPYVKVAAAASIQESVEPAFATLPGPLSKLHFTRIDLGSVPIRMDNVVVHRVDEKNNTLQFDLDLVWDGECDGFC